MINFDSKLLRLDFMKISGLFQSFYFIITLSFLLACAGSKKSSSSSMGLFKMVVNEPIEGVCDNANVIAPIPTPGSGQVKAGAPKSNGEIAKNLNEQLAFLKENPAYEDEGKFNLIINCKGELVQVSIDKKSKSANLDKQIMNWLQTLKQWKPATVNGKPYDSVVFFSYTIKAGVIYVN